MPSFNKSASYPLPRINDGQIWLDGLLPRLDTVPLCCLFLARLLVLFQPSLHLIHRLCGLHWLHGCTVTGYTVSAYQRISASSYQHISVSTFQRISVSTFQRIDVPAYQRTGVPAHQCITLQACNLSSTQQNSVSASNHVRHALPQLSFFPEFVAALAFVANGRVWLQNAKKKPGKCPKLKIKRIAKKTKQQSPPQKLQPLLNKAFAVPGPMLQALALAPSLGVRLVAALHTFLLRITY